MIDFKSFLSEQYSFKKVKLSMLNEKKLNAMSYDRFLKYAHLVIDDIEKGIPIKSVYDTSEIMDKNDAKILKSFLDLQSIDSLNDSLKRFRFSNGWRWTEIFKGKYSGYEKGLASKNRGNAVEDASVKDIQDYINFGYDNCKQYVKDIVDLIEKKYGNYDIVDVIQEGGKNQKRNLDVDSNGCPTIKNASGATLTDVTLICQDRNDRSKKEYLSLKFGNTVSFINAGIKSIFKEDEMKQCALSGDISNMNKKSIGFLERFGLDPLKFCVAFTEYNPETAKTTKGKTRDLTSSIENISYSFEGDFKEFLKNVIGYDYILVHSHDTLRNNVSIKDMTKDFVESLVDGKANATIYWPLNGNKKNVVISLTLKDTLNIELTLRSTSGSIFPDKLLANYKFLK